MFYRRCTNKEQIKVNSINADRNAYKTIKKKVIKVGKKKLRDKISTNKLLRNITHSAIILQNFRTCLTQEYHFQIVQLSLDQIFFGRCNYNPLTTI